MRSGWASVAWRLFGWLVFLVLSAYVFRYMVLFLVGLCALIVCWFVYTVVAARLKNDELKSLSAAEKKAHYVDDFRFYTIGRTVDESRYPLPSFDTRPLCGELLNHLHAGEPYHYEFNGGAYYIHDGIPKMGPSFDGVITLHVHSSWSGFFPKSPKLNALVHNQLGFNSAFQSSLDRAVALPFFQSLPSAPNEISNEEGSSGGFNGCNDGAVLVSFEMPTGEVSSLNFGQKDDALAISHAYETLCREFPKARIVIYAECLGGLRVMNWLRSPLEGRLAGLILESPLPSVQHMLSFTKSDRMNRWLYRMFCLLVPNFNAELDRYNRYEFPDVPALIGVISSDWVSNSSHLTLWTSRFSRQIAAVCDDPHLKHGDLFKAPKFKDQVRAFYDSLCSAKPKSPAI